MNWNSLPFATFEKNSMRLNVDGFPSAKHGFVFLAGSVGSGY